MGDYFFVPYAKLTHTFKMFHANILNVFNALINVSSSKSLFSCVLSGEGGRGKTRVAIEIAYANKNLFSGGVYWLNCKNTETMLNSLEQITEQLGVQLSRNGSELERWKIGVKCVQKVIGRQLWILDNVENKGLLELFYQAEFQNVFILVTTRLGKLNNIDFNYCMPLPDFQQAEEMFYNYCRKDKAILSKEEQDAAIEILKCLNYSPLAIELAGNIIHENKYTLGTYLQLFIMLNRKIHGIDDQKNRLEDSNIVSIKATFSCDQRIYQEPILKKLLFHISLLNSEHIEEDLLVRILDQNIEKQLRYLVQLGCIKVKRDSRIVYCIHPLIQDSIRIKEEKELPIDEHMEKLYNYLCIRDIQKDYSKLIFLRMHAEKGYEIPGSSYVNKANFACWIAQWFNISGNYQEAEKWNLRYLSNAEFVGAIEIANAKENLAGVLQEMGRYEEAEKLYKESLKIKEETYEVGHPSIAIAKGNLAGVLQEMGKYGEAEKLYNESLKIKEAAYSEGHLSIATTKGNLAGVLQRMGRYEEAEKLYRESLKIKEEAYEDGHPSIAIDKGNLAGVLQDMGRYQEAEKLYRETLDIHSITFGKKHPYIAIAKGNLAGLLQEMGRYEEAEKLYRETLAIDEEAYEEGHPSIAIDKGNLAGVLKEMGRYQEAEKLYWESLKIMEEAYEEGHPAIAIDKGNLAGVLQEMGRYQEAEKLYRESLKIKEEAYGEGHPEIAINKLNLAALLHTTQRYSEAELLAYSALQIFTASLPISHPYIAVTKEWLAQILLAQGKLTETLPLLPPDEQGQLRAASARDSCIQ